MEKDTIPLVETGRPSEGLDLSKCLGAVVTSVDSSRVSPVFTGYTAEMSRSVIKSARRECPYAKEGANGSYSCDKPDNADCSLIN